MKCSLCIPTYKRAASLNNLLSAVVGMNDSRIGEVLIAISYKEEDSINEQTPHFLRMLEILNIPYRIECGFNGLIAAKAWFKAEAKEDILLVADDDCIFSRDYLNLLDDFENEKVAAVSGTLQTPLDINHYKAWSYDDIPNPPENMVCNKVTVDENGTVIIKDKYQVYMLKEKKKYACECLVGTAMFIKREALTVDPTYARGGCCYEEYDYTYAAYREGRTLIYDSSEVAFHLHEETGGMRNLPDKQKKQNSDYFKKKWQL